MNKNDIPCIFKKHTLFEGFSDQQLDTLFSLMEHKTVPPEKIIIREGEESNELYFILEGTTEVLKTQGGKSTQHRLATLHAGDCFGELALVQKTYRTATIRAVTEVKLLVLSADAFRSLLEDNSETSRLIYKNLSQKLSKQVLQNNELLIQALEKELEQEKNRSAIGTFIITTIAGLCLFSFLLTLATNIVKAMGTGAIVTIALLIIYTIFYLINVHYSGFKKSFYGLTLIDWRRSIYEAILFTAPILIFFTIAKWILINYFLTHSVPLFDPLAGIKTTHGNELYLFLMGFAYLFISAPLQEIIIRGGLQNSFQEFLNSPYRKGWGIFLSNLIFATAHLTLSFKLAIGAFIIGLFLGWLYSRHKSLAGVILSHILVGFWLLFVLGIQDVMF